jgi:uncharacterized protein (TIGR02453 family)
MKSLMDMKPLLEFLGRLEQNNNKAWFEAQRAAYETARRTFEEFIDDLIRGVSKFDDLGDLSTKECIFRINRDVRFSKDKSPYKPNMGASLAPGGRKSTRLGYYIHIAPHDESMIAGGLHMPMPPQLSKFRQAIDHDSSTFKKITRSKSFTADFGTVSGSRLSTAPQGYARDHPEIELLQLKEIVAVHHLADETVLSPDLAPHTLRVFKAMKPFLDYLNSVTR